MYTTLIEPAELAAHTHDPDWVVLDCRFDLAKPAWGEAEYARGHVPNALYAHLDRDLSSAVTATSGRHPLPPRRAQWAATHARGIIFRRPKVLGLRPASSPIPSSIANHSRSVTVLAT